MDAKQPITPANFEQALARLEEIANTLDRNDVPLAEALDLCAEATALRQFCHAQLNEAEGKLLKLEELANGEMRLEPLTGA